MKSIQYVTNGVGAQEPSELHSTAGLTLRNATGDIDSVSTGFQIAIDTITYIKKKITQQSFYEVAPADFLPVTVGEGAFAQSILTNVEFSNNGDFESGNINSGSNNDRLAQSDASVASKTFKVINWGVKVGYNIFDIEQALAANNWDVIEAKHRSRKKLWDLGIQEIAFLGSIVDTTNVPGLFTSAAYTINTSIITKYISTMTAAEFMTFIQTVVAAYFANTASTKLPNRFVIPTADYLGLATAVSSTYPNISQLEWLEKSLQAMCPGMKILHTAYAQAANNSSRGLNKACYLMYRYDEESLRMDIPVDYTVTAPNTNDNFNFTDVGYGQYTGMQLIKNLEVLAFQF